MSIYVYYEYLKSFYFVIVMFELFMFSIFCLYFIRIGIWVEFVFY